MIRRYFSLGKIEKYIFLKKIFPFCLPNREVDGQPLTREKKEEKRYKVFYPLSSKFKSDFRENSW